MQLFPPQHLIPPESYGAWENACATMGTLRELHFMTIDLTFWNYYDYQSVNTIAPDDFVAILEPLKKITAKVFVVELNAELCAATRAALEPLNFHIEIRHRPYNSEVFRQG